MAYFDFKRLIDKYSTDFTAEIPSKGDYNDAGEWEEGKSTPKKLHGAIIGHRESKIFRSEGTLTGQDRALYMLSALPEGLNGAKITHEGKIYSIGDMLENSTFTGVWAYTLKYISAFGGDNE